MKNSTILNIDENDLLSESDYELNNCKIETMTPIEEIKNVNSVIFSNSMGKHWKPGIFSSSMKIIEIENQIKYINILIGICCCIPIFGCLFIPILLCINSNLSQKINSLVKQRDSDFEEDMESALIAEKEYLSSINTK